MKHVNQALQDNLWESLRNGDHNALSQLYDLLAADLYRYGYTLIQNKAVVEDSLHELFLQLHTNRQWLEPNDNVRLYLFQVLRQRLLDTEARLNMDDSKTAFSRKSERLIMPRTQAGSHVVNQVMKRVYKSITLALTLFQAGKRNPLPQRIARI